MIFWIKFPPLTCNRSTPEIIAMGLCIPDSESVTGRYHRKMITFVDIAECGSHSRSDQGGGTQRVLREVLGMTQLEHHCWALVGSFLKLETARTQVSSSKAWLNQPRCAVGGKGLLLSLVIYLCSVSSFGREPHICWMDNSRKVC